MLYFQRRNEFHSSFSTSFILSDNKSGTCHLENIKLSIRELAYFFLLEKNYIFLAYWNIHEYLCKTCQFGIFYIMLYNVFGKLMI